MMRKPKFEMLAANDGKVFFQLKAANGEIVLLGRGYPNKFEAIQAIASVMRYGTYEMRYARKQTADGRHFFQLLSPSSRILGWSEMYPSKQGRDNGIMAVRRAVQFGRVLDLN